MTIILFIIFNYFEAVFLIKVNKAVGGGAVSHSGPTGANPIYLIIEVASQFRIQTS